MWRKGLSRWNLRNRKFTTMVDETPSPGRNEEYLLYQTLVGTWPFCSPEDNEFVLFRSRIREYMLKAMREAKVHTSWINPNTLHEDAVMSFIDSVLTDSRRNNFLHDFALFQRLTANCGIFNSLSQALLKITSPGIPDIYQGNELWDFSLVDPDNRRPVDFSIRKNLLGELLQKESRVGSMETAREVVATRNDGRIKLYLTCKALNFRRDNRELFDAGGYRSLEIEGACREHVCAFERTFNDRSILVVAPRFFSRLTGDGSGLPLGSEAWQDTRIIQLSGTATDCYRNIFTGEVLHTDQQEGGQSLALKEILSVFPVALLEQILPLEP
jgi:(1->4)-alpha-D-glucan 1-alpha-D-glucosylmutase